MDKARVLIVDDHEEVLKGLRALLELEESNEVVGSATSGAEAVLAARELRPDLVLMDFSMEDMDGIAAASAIKQDDPGVEVVILSVYEGTAEVERARRAGIERWIPKSLPPEKLLAELRSISCLQQGE